MKCSACKARALLLLFHTGSQLSFPNMVCLHFSVTHRSTAMPVAPPSSNHRTSPLWTARPAFQSCDTNPLQISKKQAVKTSVSAVISQVRTIATDIAVLDRQLQLDTNYSLQTVPPLQARAIALNWGACKAALTAADKRSVWRVDLCWITGCMRSFQLAASKCFSAGHLWRVTHVCVRGGVRLECNEIGVAGHLAHNLAFWDQCVV